MDDVTVRITGDAEFERKVKQLQLFLADLRTFWPLLVPVFIGWMGAQFATEGGWGGQTWAPLSPQYAVWKGVHYPGRTILIRDGNLRRAASEPRREATPRTLTLWIDDPIAAYHQEGTAGTTRHRRGVSELRLGEGAHYTYSASTESSTSGGMPARPLIPDRLPAAALRDIDDAAHVYVSTLVRNLGL